MERKEPGSRYYYAGYSYMGTNFTYDSPCWTVYVFNSKKERREWLDDNTYDCYSNNIVAEPIDRKTAYRIVKYKKHKNIYTEKTDKGTMLFCMY